MSIPDDVFESAERLARRGRISRSELYANALRALIAEDDSTTEALDRVHGGARPADTDEFAVEAARRVVAATDW